MIIPLSIELRWARHDNLQTACELWM